MPDALMITRSLYSSSISSTPFNENNRSMARILYCWRCRAEVPMLEEDEWEEILRCLREGVEQIKDYRSTNSLSFEEAKDQVYGHGALLRYQQITGSCESNPTVLWHHRLSLFGPPCTNCGKPLRTP